MLFFLFDIQVAIMSDCYNKTWWLFFFAFEGILADPIWKYNLHIKCNIYI